MAGDEAGEGVEKLSRLNQVYLAIISRYKDYIQEKESISVAELPTLVTPKSGAVAKKAAEIRGSFEPYSYERNFYDAAAKAFSFVRDDIESAALPLEFWLSPEDTLTYKMGDVIDKNILLCSILVALGNPSAKVLVKMRENNINAFTYFEFNGRVYVLDIGNGIKEFDDKNAMVASLGIDEDTSVYEFNNQTYVDIA